MVFGWDKIRPKFYPLMDGSLPHCLVGEKATLPGAQFGFQIATPALIHDPGTSIFIQLPPTSTESLKKAGHMFVAPPCAFPLSVWATFTREFQIVTQKCIHPSTSFTENL